MEWKRMLRYEKKVFNDFENKIIISEQDRELILASENLPLSKQEEIINQKFENWKGNLIQVDDICVAGIKIF